MEIIDLPAGWSKAVVGDYFFLKNGFAFKSNDYIPASDKSYPVIRISDLDGKIATDSNAVHVLDGAPGFEVKNGDLLIAMSGATTGKIGVYQGKEPAYQNQRVGNLKLHSEVNGCNDYKNYLVYFLSDDILKIAYGGAQPNISGKAIEEMEVLLPPLAEQKVIAEKLDTLLAQVDNTKARLERIPDILKRFRQSVLAAAVSGKLTEEWRGDSSYREMKLNLEKAAKSIEIPTTWSKITLSDSCKVISGNAFKSQDFLSEGQVPAIKISNVQYGQFEIKNQQFLPLEYLKAYKNFIVSDGDLLMALTRPITNDTLKVCRYPVGEPVGLLNQRVAKFIFKNEDEKAFFELLFQSDYFKVQVLDKLSETLQPNLSPVDLKKFIVALPSELEQTEIVRRVEELFAFADRIEHAAQAALSRVNNLTQSILAKAFRGELTADWRADNPELISGENSAEALLARIKAERAKVSQTKKGRGKSVEN